MYLRLKARVVRVERHPDVSLPVLELTDVEVFPFILSGVSSQSQSDALPSQIKGGQVIELEILTKGLHTGREFCRVKIIEG